LVWLALNCSLTLLKVDHIHSMKVLQFGDLWKPSLRVKKPSQKFSQMNSDLKLRVERQSHSKPKVSGLSQPCYLSSKSLLVPLYVREVVLSKQANYLKEPHTHGCTL
jgi:hypothetical protein